MRKGGSDTGFPVYPRVEARIRENPARWLTHCEDGLTRTANALIRGIQSPERAHNWRYVARDMGVPEVVRDRIDGRIARLAAREEQARLRDVYCAPPERLDSIRDRALDGRVSDADKLVIGLVHSRNAADSQSVDATSGTTERRADADEPDSDPTPESREDATETGPETRPEPPTGRKPDLSPARAKELTSVLSYGRVKSLLQLERASETPRRNVIAALEARRDALEQEQTARDGGKGVPA